MPDASAAVAFAPARPAIRPPIVMNRKSPHHHPTRLGRNDVATADACRARPGTGTRARRSGRPSRPRPIPGERTNSAPGGRSSLSSVHPLVLLEGDRPQHLPPAGQGREHHGRGDDRPLPGGRGVLEPHQGVTLEVERGPDTDLGGQEQRPPEADQGRGLHRRECPADVAHHLEREPQRHERGHPPSPRPARAPGVPAVRHQRLGVPASAVQPHRAGDEARHQTDQRERRGGVVDAQAPVDGVRPSAGPDPRGPREDQGDGAGADRRDGRGHEGQHAQGGQVLGAGRCAAAGA